MEENGIRLVPKEINIRRNIDKSKVEVSNIDVESYLNDGKLEIDTKLFKEGISGISAIYEDLEGQYIANLAIFLNRE